MGRWGRAGGHVSGNESDTRSEGTRVRDTSVCVPGSGRWPEGSRGVLCSSMKCDGHVCPPPEVAPPSET